MSGYYVIWKTTKIRYCAKEDWMKNLEICHFYIDDFYNENYKSIISKTLENQNYIQHFSGKIVIFIDDKDCFISIDEKNKIVTIIEQIFLEHHIFIDHIYFERDQCYFFEKEIFQHLQPFIIKETFKRSKKVVFFFYDGIKKIALKEWHFDGTTQHYCVSLSLAFSVFKNQQLGKNYLLLEDKYRSVEKNVSYLKKYIHPSNDEYIFY